MEKKIYEFTNDGNSCVIYDAKPPRYWFNYLWNENGYCAQVSQNGHGRSYYLNERADMCMINNNDARYFYIRDDETNKSWNIGAAPLNEQVESYQCEHSIGFSRLQSECQGIESSWSIFVPQTGFQEVWTFRLKNKSRKTRTLSTFSAVTFELEGFSYPRYYEMEYIVDPLIRLHRINGTMLIWLLPSLCMLMTGIWPDSVERQDLSRNWMLLLMHCFRDRM